MDTNKKIARVAGALYLIVVLTGMFSLGYVPAKVNVAGDIGKTIANIVTFETLYRLGIAAGMVCYVAFLILPFVLYRLLSSTHEKVAVMMVAFAVVSVPISFLNLQHKMTVLSLLTSTNYTDTIPTDHLHALIRTSLHNYNNGIELVSIFWGLWLLPFGYLVFKSGLLPKVFGVLLMAGCFGYLVNGFGALIYPPYDDTMVPSILSAPSGLGEIGICLWLLIMGAREYSKAKLV